MSLSTYFLEYGRHVGQLRRRRRRCRAYEPTSNTASHDNHEKINSWVSFSSLYEYGAPLGGPSGRRSSARNTSGSLGEREMLWEHEPQASVSTAFSSSPKLHECFYNSVETRRTCYLFLLVNTLTK